MKPTAWSCWRHYKSIWWDNHTYRVIGIAKHSETEEEMVIYTPLYSVWEDSWAYGHEYIVRPLSLWYDIVDSKWEKVQRFREI